MLRKKQQKLHTNFAPFGCPVNGRKTHVRQFESNAVNNNRAVGSNWQLR